MLRWMYACWAATGTHPRICLCALAGILERCGGVLFIGMHLRMRCRLAQAWVTADWRVGKARSWHLINQRASKGLCRAAVGEIADRARLPAASWLLCL